MTFDINTVLDALRLMGNGMLGIFAVTLVIIGVVTLLNKIPNKKK